ncbi:hypothetical protein [Chondromyces apiculatus]|uniref:Glycoside hydrolase family 5 domain-containing protein n=1 Tax=Chondromyces apiculatus DSM 436 TaxID=1192034 RepID=A0A017TAY3_9BACT|nr:hypothetical protein [Chondromyces apiculatus]EYF06448.1 Hypothetical protein CAP_1978 [Chondromyces apiculatus DSM 436]
MHRRAASLVLAAAALLPLAAACGGDGSGSTEGAGANGAGASSGTGGDGAGGGQGGEGGGSGDLGQPFRYGVNFGYPNSGWNDAIFAELARDAGANGSRLKLSETHLDTWGVDIEVGDMEAYADLGMSRHAAFLIGPTAEHSTAPSGTPDWELEHYIPRDLYEPITLPDGSINPGNPWGAYVHATVSTYKPWVRTWEVWNEPDWVSDWQATQTWWTEPPTKEQLVRFGGSIFDYVRMLRVTYEAAHLADPEAQVALGGIGYPSFLSAVLRYTDDPQGGAVSDAYPETGAAYFDVVSFHYYPLYTPGSSDSGVSGFLGLHDELATELSSAGVSGKGWIVTETGAPRLAIGQNPGGAAYARNYLLKVMTSAQAAGIEGVDWFVLGDGAADDSTTDPYGLMGLYRHLGQLSSPDQAELTETGWAYRTLGTLLADARHDRVASEALALPASVGGAAFRLPDMRQAVVLWARADGNAETATATYALETSRSFAAHRWDFSQTQTTEPLSPTDGKIALDLDATPRIFIEQ